MKRSAHGRGMVIALSILGSAIFILDSWPGAIEEIRYRIICAPEIKESNPILAEYRAYADSLARDNITRVMLEGVMNVKQEMVEESCRERVSRNMRIKNEGRVAP